MDWNLPVYPDYVSGNTLLDHGLSRQGVSVFAHSVRGPSETSVPKPTHEVSTLVQGLMRAMF